LEGVKISPLRKKFADADVSAHSLRSGGASALLRAHLDYELIRIFGRWKSDVARIYTRSNHHQMKGVAVRMLQAQGARVRTLGGASNPQLAWGRGDPDLAGLALNSHPAGRSALMH